MVMVPSDLRFFARDEFRNPDLMDGEFCYFLDAVRSRYGAPLTITSDARTVEEEQALPAHADQPESSLHVLGRAVDLRWIPDKSARYAFNRAVVFAASALSVAPELEYVPSGAQPHIHLGAFKAPHPPTLIFA
jgi:hypothetical protein